MKTIFAFSFLSFTTALFHVTPPRHVTVSVRLGAVLDGVDGPGFRFKSPIVTSYDLLVEEQLDTVMNVECGTKDGITLKFPKIDVHNLLPWEKAREMFLRYGPDYDQLTIFKNVKFFVGQICGDLTAEEVYLTKYNGLDEQLQELLRGYQDEKDTGISITKVKFYKPSAKGSTILSEFQRRAEGEAERKALVAQEKKIEQSNKNKLSEAEGTNALVTAENRARLERELDSMRSEAAKQLIEMEMKTAAATGAAEVQRIKADAEADNIRKLAKARADGSFMEAKANKELLTPEYLSKVQAESLSKNAKLIIGNEIPKVLFSDLLALNSGK